MTRTLALLGDTPAARPVLETAVLCGRLLGTEVEALHVGDRRDEAPPAVVSLAARLEVPLRTVAGPVAPTLLRSLEDADVAIAVVGGRTEVGPSPEGTVVARLLGATTKPIVVVPPDATSPRRIGRLLVPLEGDEASSSAVADWLLPHLNDDVELVVLHAFTAATQPGMLDRPEHDWSLLGREFLARHFPAASSVELRTGAAAQEIGEASGTLGVDLVVMSWAQDASPGRAATLRAVLDTSSLPVLIVPGSRPTTSSATQRHGPSFGPLDPIQDRRRTVR